ncbi:MAG: hypothetical protein GPJ21_07480 [Microcystis aeruginosa W13-11]|nr:hypothetical protein [Microcystis aeruginosa W13-11]
MLNPPLSPSPPLSSRKEGGIIADESYEQLQLRLTGLVVKREGRLKVYNPIYAQVFNGQWVARALADLRPGFYGEAFKAWQEAQEEQKESFLLRGQALREAETWAKGKRLSKEDERFLDDSRDCEKRDMERRLAAETEANQILTAAREQAETEREEAQQELVETRIKSDSIIQAADKRNRWSIRGLIAAGLIASIALVFANWAITQAKKAQTERDTARKQTQKVVQDAEKEKQKILSDADKEKTRITDENNRKIAKANKTLETAQKKERDARRQYQQAQEQVQKATLRLNQVNQDKIQAEEATAAAKEQLQEANTQKLQAETAAKNAKADVKKAQTTLAEATTSLKIAQAGTQIEQRGSAALQQFDKNQTSALLTAMEAGQELQTLVRKKAKIKGAKLINQKLALIDYPAISPVGALQQILTQIQGRTIPTRQGRVLSVSWTRDGQTLATGGDDGSVKLWKRDGSPITRLNAEQGSVWSVSWTGDGQTLATGGDDGSVKLWPSANLDTLLVQGCNWLEGYLIQSPRDLQKLKVCQTTELLLASAPNLVADSEVLARDGKINEAIEGFKIAQKWNPSLRFDPVVRANQLANDAKKGK